MQLGEDWEHTNKIWINIKECASQKEKKKRIRNMPNWRNHKRLSQTIWQIVNFICKKGKSLSYHLNTTKLIIYKLNLQYFQPILSIIVCLNVNHHKFLYSLYTTKLIIHKLNLQYFQSILSIIVCLNLNHHKFLYPATQFNY